MRLLLDTHVLVWLAEGLELLGEETRRAIDQAASEAGVAVSAITFWEVAMLQQRGRLALTTPVAEWRRRVLEAPGLAEIEITGDIAVESVLLPGNLHSDPADRLLVATARVRGMKLATRDTRLLEYAAGGHIATLRA